MAEAKSPHAAVKIDISGTRYTLVRKVSEQLNMTIVESESDDSDLYWIDAGVPFERYLQFKPYQMINHFSGMGEISRKDLLAKNIQKMKCVQAEEYNILPRTWILPSEYIGLSSYMKDLKRKRKQKTFIIKPPNSSMGNGISLARSIADVPQGENVIVQEYIENPLLLDGFKFDLRIYVLITACNPLRIFIYQDGLVRLSTESYHQPTDSNIDKNFMHLTNYSINKYSDSFDHHEDFDKGSKRSLKYLNGWLINNSYNTAELWARIHDLVIKTLIVAQPNLRHSYQACRPGNSGMDKCQSFEILGFDILLDENLKPWLLEVNRSPSFGIDAQIDRQIKTGVITDALRLIDIRPCNKQKKSVVQQRMTSQRRLSKTQRLRSPLDFAGEAEDAYFATERKIEEIRNRLSSIRREKEVEQFEEQYMGDYSRIYPSPNHLRQVLYDKLLADSSRICFAIKPESRASAIKGLDKMKEKELVDLLDQYESDEAGRYLDPSYRTRLKSFQPLLFRERSPLEAEFQAMAAREYEEEQTQRTMLSLNTLKPSYPGKNKKEIENIIQEVMSLWVDNRSKVGQFWLNILDSMKRKQLLFPMRDIIRGILHTHWRTAVLDTIRLHKVFLRLFNFFLSNRGQGLWCTFPGGGTNDDHWEKLFKRKSDVLSITEMYCCRRVVQLVQGTVMAAFSYYQRQLATKKSNPPPLLRRRTTCASINQRPLTVSEQRKPSSSSSIIHLNHTRTSKQPVKCSVSLTSCSSIDPTQSFPRISSTITS